MYRTIRLTAEAYRALHRHRLWMETIRTSDGTIPPGRGVTISDALLDLLPTPGHPDEMVSPEEYDKGTHGSKVAPPQTPRPSDAPAPV
jgi:hypothetical protein